MSGLDKDIPEIFDVISDNEKITDVDLLHQMQDSFLEYAYSVIHSRALPDARDGLKPVQRRILYTMSRMGLSPDKAHVKCARVTGEVMGKLHPHGDAAIYDTLVRMSQDFTMRIPLIDGHGNFGSLNDGPAASRYTEARLSRAAVAMINDLESNVVDFVPNYDNQFMQPEVLPALLPNLIVNGSSGIAVGMATSIPPHNLQETVRAAIYLVRNRQSSLEQIMKILPGPDFPTGSIIVGKEAFKEIYATGKGSFKIRAKISIDYAGIGHTNLVITELPYMVGSERVIEKIKQGVNAHRIDGILDVTDLSDRKNGLKLVIGIKPNFSPNEVMDNLYRHTPLEESFSVNSVALIDGKPKTLGMLDMLKVFIDHRVCVITRRSKFYLATHKKRLHMIDGLLLALVDIDKTISIIRNSEGIKEARKNLMKCLNVTRDQAEYILDIRLNMLTKLSTIKLQSEQEELRKTTQDLEEILSDPNKIDAILIDELKKVAQRLPSPRRTILESSVKSKKQKTDYPRQVVLTTNGFIFTIEVNNDLISELSQPETFDMAFNTRSEPLRVVKSSIVCGVRSRIGALTSAGKVIPFTPIGLPVLDSGFVTAKSFLGLENDEEAVLLFELHQKESLAIATSSGIVKRVTPAIWPDRTERVITLSAGDRVVGAARGVSSCGYFVFITAKGNLLHYSAGLVNPQNRPARGVAGVTLKDDDDRVISFGYTEDVDRANVLTVSKRMTTSRLSSYQTRGRATRGVQCHKFLKGEEWLHAAIVGENLAAIDNLGNVVAIGKSSVTAKSCAGVKQYRLPQEKSGKSKREDRLIRYLGYPFVHGNDTY